MFRSEEYTLASPFCLFLFQISERFLVQAVDWNTCLRTLESELPAQQFNTWVRPLHAVALPGTLKLLAPNRFVVDWVKAHLVPRLSVLMSETEAASGPLISVEVGSKDPATESTVPHRFRETKAHLSSDLVVGAPLQDSYTFHTFVEGRSNQLAKTAAAQVADAPGGTHNPLFLYGGVGLGKTHFMHAIGNFIRQREPDARIAYVHSERFVGDMVRALQHNSMSAFKSAYRSLDVLLIDDTQFFANKDRSQEEFLHTFNELLEGQHQIVLTCDRYPHRLEGIQERLTSRLGSGLTVAIEPPELETCVAIVMSKARQVGVHLPEEVALFIGKRIRSNVRELEGALRRVIATSRFTGQPITVEVAKEALKDLLSMQSRRITIENIQKTVADYYKIRAADMLSKRRNRSVAGARHIAMAITRELTTHSFPEIAGAFGGRDHTTVMHACKRVKQLRDSERQVGEDYLILLRTLNG